MLPEIEKLLILQDRDQRIKKLRHEQTSLPAEKRKLSDRVAAAQSLLNDVRDRIRENEIERRKLELEVEAKQAAIARFRQQQQGTRKNEEYQALAHEIAYAEVQIRQIEDRELELMEAAEALVAPMQSAEADFALAEAVAAEQFAKLDAGAAGLKERLQEVETERLQFAEAIPAETLDLYQRLFQKKGDLVVVPVEGEVCGGCHVRAPAQTLIQLRGDRQLIQCPNCGRILYRTV